MKRVRLTKKRLATLDAALSVDDILYAKYQQMMRIIHEREDRFRARHVIRQVRRRVGGVDFIMQILKVVDTDDGLVVIVR